MRKFVFPLTSAAGFGLGLALLWAGALTLPEALASGVAFSLCAALAGGLAGIKRIGAELSLIPPAYVLTLTADPTQRLMLFQALLTVALGLVVCLRHSQERPLAPWEWATAAGIPVLSGLPTLVAKFGWTSAWSLTVPAGGWLLARPLGPWSLPLIWLAFSPLHPGVLLGLLCISPLLSRHTTQRALAKVMRSWAVPVLASAGLATVLLPFGGLLAFPGGWFPPKVVGFLGVLAVVTAFAKPALAAAIWAWGIWFALPLLPTPPDRPGPSLTVAAPTRQLPEGKEGTLYQLELALAHAAGLGEKTPVAYLEVAGQRIPLRAGSDTVEWAALRKDVVQNLQHSLPRQPVFRPSLQAPWAVAGRVELFVPPGERPRVTRNPSLPPEVTVSFLQAGPGAPTPERSWDARKFLLFALGVATAFLLSGWAHPWAVAPFVVITFARLWLGLPLQPSRTLMERHGVDLALMALLLAWSVAFRQSFRRRKGNLPLAGLLLLLAVLAPQLAPLAGDEPYHVALAESLRRDGDLDPSNNVDPRRYPQWIVDLIQQAQGRYLHSPAFAFLLFPGYLTAGRVGMVVTVALTGWLMLVALGKRAQQLAFAGVSRFFALLLTALSYPFLLFARQLWPEVPAAAVVAWQLLWAAGGRLGPSATAAVIITLVKTRLGLVTVPLAGAVLFTRESTRKRLLFATLVAASVGAAALGLAALWFGNPLDPLGRRAWSHLLPRTFDQPLRVILGLALDGAYGLAFAAPMWLGAFAGIPHLWRRGGIGERVLLLGAGATLAALLSNVEWRGGGSPPFRYLVVLLPAFSLLLLASWQTVAGRAATLLTLPPTLLVAWIAVTRPSLLYNIGDGGHWLADRLAVRLVADVRHFFPSYLRISLASWLAPFMVCALTVLAWRIFTRQARLRRWLCRQTVAFWLLAAAALVLAVRIVPDRLVEMEDPQVQHLGGMLEPHPGAWSRFLYPNGWRLAHGEGVVVPLRLGANQGLLLKGWVEGSGSEGCLLMYGFLPEEVQGTVALPQEFRQGLALPGHPSGRAWLKLTVACPPGVTVILDRLEVRP
ncbi:MAG: hypothetical protein ACUVRY_01665 [Thermoanaerobaculaceae bacterium]